MEIKCFAEIFTEKKRKKTLLKVFLNFMHKVERKMMMPKSSVGSLLQSEALDDLVEPAR